MALEQLGAPVDVAEHQVSAQRVTGAQGRLQIYTLAHAPLADGGQGQSLGGDVRNKSVRRALGHRQAHAGDRDTVAKRHASRIDLGSFDGQALIAPARFEGVERAYGLNNAGKQR